MEGFEFGSCTSSLIWIHSSGDTTLLWLYRTSSNCQCPHFYFLYRPLLQIPGYPVMPLTCPSPCLKDLSKLIFKSSFSIFTPMSGNIYLILPLAEANKAFTSHSTSFFYAPHLMCEEFLLDLLKNVVSDHFSPPLLLPLSSSSDLLSPQFIILATSWWPSWQFLSLLI